MDPGVVVLLARTLKISLSPSAVVHAKTGTLAKARNLSGYVTTADGERLIFSVLANNTTTPGSMVTDVADQIGAALAAYRGH